ncbi:hypothetical protein RIF29_15642 [Crotalaria pallida]|uniref:RmlD-like substrate binding domain-containing protein n=1 Tax=Crotalaria pallida TaxID=3830 RepID=A0AAN9FM76_CROPI
MSSKKKVVVVGGTGYLGQHLLQAYYGNGTSAYDVAFTHHSNLPPQPLLDAIPGSIAFQLDLKTDNGFEAISIAFGQPDVVVNCAAISVPRACEIDPAAARVINVPSSLVQWLQSFKEKSTLLIHLSTDQVYEGKKSFYKEDDIAVPVNVYGKTKVAAEQFISDKCSNYAILRSSIIYGPLTVSPVPKSLPIQWIDGALAKGEKVEFFHDEFRCPIYVKDLVNIILALTNQWISVVISLGTDFKLRHLKFAFMNSAFLILVTEGKQIQLVLNAGGPDRLSRVQMAEAVAQFRGYDSSIIKSVSASSVDRGVKSPADTSVDITRLDRAIQEETFVVRIRPSNLLFSHITASSTQCCIWPHFTKQLRMSTFVALHSLHGSLLRSQFFGQDLYPHNKPSTIHSKPSLKVLQPCAKFDLLQIMGGRGLCNGEEGLQKELKKQVGDDDKPSPPSSSSAAAAEESEKDEANSGGSTLSTEIVAEDGFEKELMGLTGGFPGGEKGLKKFIEENPPPKKGEGNKSLKLSLSKKPKPPELPLLLPGMIAIVSNPNNPYYMYCGIVQRITDGKAGVLFEGGNWDRLITFRLEELERREKGPPMKNPKSVVLEPFLGKKS